MSPLQFLRDLNTYYHQTKYNLRPIPRITVAARLPKAIESETMQTCGLVPA